MADIKLTAAEAKLLGIIIEGMGEIDWETVATKAGYTDKKRARDKWYPIKDKLVVAGGGLAKLGSKRRANADGENGTPAPTSNKKAKSTKKTPTKGNGRGDDDFDEEEEGTSVPNSVKSRKGGKKDGEKNGAGGYGAVKAEAEDDDGYA